MVAVSGPPAMATSATVGAAPEHDELMELI